MMMMMMMKNKIEKLEARDLWTEEGNGNWSRRGNPPPPHLFMYLKRVRQGPPRAAEIEDRRWRRRLCRWRRLKDCMMDWAQGWDNAAVWGGFQEAVCCYPRRLTIMWKSEGKRHYATEYGRVVHTNTKTKTRHAHAQTHVYMHTEHIKNTHQSVLNMLSHHVALTILFIIIIVKRIITY